MLVYLAGRYSRRNELIKYAKELRRRGYQVNARWLFKDYPEHDKNLVENSRDGVPVDPGVYMAMDDYCDVQIADIVICFTEMSKSSHSRGGRHVEMGLALAWRKKIIVVGPRENIFCTLFQITQFDEWDNNVVQYLENSYLNRKGLQSLSGGDIMDDNGEVVDMSTAA